MLMKPQNWALERGFGLWDLCNRGWDHGSTPGNASHEAMLSSAHTAGTLTCSEHPAQGDSCGLSPDKCCIKRDQFDSADPLQPLMQGLLGLTGAAVRARRCLCWRAGGVQHFQHTCTFPKAKNTTPDFGRSLSDPEAFRMFLLLCFARSSCRRTWAGQGHGHRHRLHGSPFPKPCWPYKAGRPRAGCLQAGPHKPKSAAI